MKSLIGRLPIWIDAASIQNQSCVRDRTPHCWVLGIDSGSDSLCRSALGGSDLILKHLNGAFRLPIGGGLAQCAVLRHGLGDGIIILPNRNPACLIA